MTQLTGSFDRYDLGTGATDNVREQMHNVITNISPMEFPFQSNISRGSCDTDKPTWLKDALAAADSTNAWIDGDAFAAGTISLPLRLGNYCQISRKDLRVTRRADKVNKAGRKSELAYAIAKAGKELKRDVEAILTGSQAAVQGSSVLAPKTASLRTWIMDNDDLGAGAGASGSLSGGVPTVAATPGTARALSEATLLGVIENCYTAGGNPSLLMMSPTVKQKFSNYMFGTSARIATPYQDHGAKSKSGITAIGAVDVYVSDFSVMDVCPNRFQGNDDVFVLDTEYWSVDYLDGYKTEEMGQSGDAKDRVLLVDYTLCAKDGGAASGCVADIDETAAMTA